MKHLARFLPLLVIAVCGVGCAHDYQNHPAPAMASTTNRWIDAENNYVYMRNLNQRGGVDDINRAIYIDNPSRLSPWPIVDMSGNPR